MKAIFSKEMTAKTVETNKANALAKAESKKKTHTENNVLFSNFLRNEKITKTSVISLAICKASTFIKECSIQQISMYIEQDLCFDVRFARDKTTEARVRRHIKDDFVKSKLMKFDLTADLMTFSDTLRKYAKKDEKRLDKMLAQVKAVNVKHVEVKTEEVKTDATKKKVAKSKVVKKRKKADKKVA